MRKMRQEAAVVEAAAVLTRTGKSWVREGKEGGREGGVFE